MKLINCIIFLVFTSVCYSQIPIKAGMAYYKFEHNVPNKSCLSNYYTLRKDEYENNRPNTNGKFDAYETKRQNEDKKSVFSIKNKIGKYRFHWAVKGSNQFRDVPNDCTGKFKGRFEINIPLDPSGNIRTFELLGIGRKRRVKGMQFTCQPEIIFLDKENIQVKIKSINVRIRGSEGMQDFVENKELGEMYQAYLDDPNKTEKGGAMFEDIDRIIRDHVEILFEAIDDAVELYELD